MYDFVFADNDGNGYIDENYRALGRLGESFVEINPDEMIPLPQGASANNDPQSRGGSHEQKRSIYHLSA